MYKTLYQYTLIISSLFITNITLADHYSHRDGPTVSAGINFERLSINPAIANRELIGDTATAINLGFNIGEHNSRKPYIDFGAGLSFVHFDDNGQFTQATVDDFGHLINSSSDADAFHVYVEGGPSIPLSRYFDTEFKIGYTLPISSERSIDNCSACFSEDIDIDAGFYTQLGVSQKIGNVSLKASYKDYADADNGIDNSFSFGLHVRY